MSCYGLQGQKIEAEEAAAAASSNKSGENPKVFDFWGVANALADSVKKTTADISARYNSSSVGHAGGSANCWDQGFHQIT